MEPTLLLIESEPLRAQRLRDALSGTGFDLRLISDPEAAMAAARDIQPLKILIDGGSREVDAPAMVRRFAAVGQEAEIFVIASGDDAIACYENGAAAVFPSSDSETALSALAARIARPCPGADRDGQELDLQRVKGMLEDERFITVNQVLDNISLIIEQISDEVEGGVKYFTQIRQLKDNLSYLGLMMGTIAHGIKGVLTGLNGGLYLIESACRRQQQEKVEEGIAISRQMMQRMEQVVFNILYYTKKRSLSLETVEADPFAADLAAEFEPKIDSSRISFRVELDALGASLEADATMLRAALTNILENAVDACAADTEKKSHQIVFRVEQHDGQIRFDIQDDGPGMDTETRKKLFDLFYSTKGSKGTGLGMFIADKIIRQHGGRIRVESEPGEGTRFTVDLPRRIPDVLRQYRTDQIRDFEL
ncbi:MAG: hybrid sensor histidine kinase/response regulator [Desulfobacterales bacterium]|nr:hybrid sensor histidine kinase/response regulator [Desulfobacterales bacterium]